MLLIFLGLLLWSAAHFAKRLSPDLRAGFIRKCGEGPWKGLVTALLILSVLLMVFGYRGALGSPLWSLPSWAWHVNNSLMIIAVLLVGMSHSTGWLGTRLRHPMLISVIVWAIAHLLVNGDSPSLLLFGGLGLWAIVEIILINRAEGPWTRPAPGPIKKDFILAGITVAVFGVITLIHGLIGPSPFPG
ncbi:NnrU family protein [Paracoccaceae bacterium GXU_MW_L88]